MEQGSSLFDDPWTLQEQVEFSSSSLNDKDPWQHYFPSSHNDNNTNNSLTDMAPRGVANRNNNMVHSRVTPNKTNHPLRMPPPPPPPPPLSKCRSSTESSPKLKQQQHLQKNPSHPHPPPSLSSSPKNLHQLQLQQHGVIITKNSSLPRKHTNHQPRVAAAAAAAAPASSSHSLSLPTKKQLLIPPPPAYSSSSRRRFAASSTSTRRNRFVVSNSSSNASVGGGGSVKSIRSMTSIKSCPVSKSTGSRHYDAYHNHNQSHHHRPSSSSSSRGIGDSSGGGSSDGYPPTIIVGKRPVATHPTTTTTSSCRSTSGRSTITTAAAATTTTTTTRRLAVSSSSSSRSVSSLKSQKECKPRRPGRQSKIIDADVSSCAGSLTSAKTSPGRLFLESTLSSPSNSSMPKTFGFNNKKNPRGSVDMGARSQHEQHHHHHSRPLSETTTTPTVIQIVVRAPGQGGRGEKNQHQGITITPTTRCPRTGITMPTNQPKTITDVHCLSESDRKSTFKEATSTNNNNSADKNIKASSKRNLRSGSATRNRNNTFDSAATKLSSSSWSSPRSVIRDSRNTSTTITPSDAPAAPGPLLRVNSWKKVKENTDNKILVPKTSDSFGSTDRTTPTPSMEDETESLHSYSSSVDFMSQTVPHDSSSSQKGNVLLGRFKRAATRLRKGVGNIIGGGGGAGAGGNVDNDNDNNIAVTTTIAAANSNNVKQRQSMRCLHHVVVIQAQMRAFLTRKVYQKQLQAIIKIQSLIRTMKPRLKYKMRMLKRRLKHIEKAKRRDLKHMARESERVQLVIRDETKRAYNVEQVASLKQKQQKAEKAAALIKALQSHNKKLRSQGKHLEEACTEQVDMMLDAIIANANQTLRALRKIEKSTSSSSSSSTTAPPPVPPQQPPTKMTTV